MFLRITGLAETMKDITDKDCRAAQLWHFHFCKSIKMLMIINC